MRERGLRSNLRALRLGEPQSEEQREDGAEKQGLRQTSDADQASCREPVSPVTSVYFRERIRRRR